MSTVAAIFESNQHCKKSGDILDGSESGKDDVTYQIVLESTDSNTDPESSESICSIQGDSTVSARDSSDIITEYSTEFEIATSPETGQHPWSFTQDISSSENATRQTKVIDFNQLETDSSTCEFSSNSSYHNSGRSFRFVKFTRCAMCSSTNHDSSFQFCNSCYKIKKGFFPEKPKAGKRKRRMQGENFTKRTAIAKTDVFATISSVLNDVDGSLTCASVRNNSSVICEDYPADRHSASKITSTVSERSSVTVCSSVTDSGFETNNSQEWNMDVQEADKCLACLDNSSNALFLHGKTGHRCCCYQCAKRIWFETGRCPICRSKVSNIIRILDS